MWYMLVVINRIEMMLWNSIITKKKIPDYLSLVIIQKFLDKNNEIIIEGRNDDKKFNFLKYVIK